MTQTYLSIASNKLSAQPVNNRSFDAYALETMIPKMIGYWPASSAQFEKNAPILIEAYREKLSNFSGDQISQALAEMSDDGKRMFAPIAGELKAFLVSRQCSASPARRFIVSISSLEMQICTKCLSGQIEKTQQAADTELNAMIESVYVKGGEVVGNRGFAPLKSIIRG